MAITGKANGSPYSCIIAAKPNTTGSLIEKVLRSLKNSISRGHWPQLIAPMQTPISKKTAKRFTRMAVL
jgi:hypothetical protein